MDGVSVNLNEQNYRFAFTVESYKSPRQQKNDPRYVKYLVRVIGNRNGKEFQRVLSYHNCTNEEFNEFYPIKSKYTSFLKGLKENPERGMFCIDWDDNLPYEVYGSELTNDYSRLDIAMVPCNYLHTMLDYKGDSVSSECIGDLEQ